MFCISVHHHQVVMYSPVLLLFICAAALAFDDMGLKPSPKRPPQYFQALNLVRKAERLLEAHQTNVKLPVYHSHRQYALLVGVMDDAAKSVAAKCTRNVTAEYYKSVEKAVPISWNNPVQVSKNMKKFLDVVHEKTDDFRDLVDSVCKKQTGARTNDCNYLVELLVHDNPKRYAVPAALILEMEPLSGFYLQNSIVLQQAADSNGMIRLLLKDYPNKFINILPQMGLVFRKLFKYPPC
ncbi:uncharacterized protein LOC116413645 [Galleria mellonella]|uniref:Uncharacterized protein LOC116413645 n=1 Tax=Galleria mellonella TaxID=7137 RepID=A0A6J3CBU6_GALME|nr:uncharacterized protein LOC116413645 [Galleria mellonella]